MNERALFHPGVVYPCDRKGRYVELEGEVVAADEHGSKNTRILDNTIGVDVKTEEGTFRAYTIMPAVVGDKAKVRLYDWGGGHYPGNEVVSLSYTGPR